MKKNVVKEKSFAFAIRIVKLYQFLNSEKKEFILSKQLLKSGTAIGALVRESEFAESKADFIHKISIAQKEANETMYWLELLEESGYLNKTQFDSIYPQSVELLRLITAILKTSKESFIIYH